MLFPISIAVDGYIQADNYEEAQAARLELRELKLQNDKEPDDPFGINLEQTEIVDTAVLPGE